MTVHVLSAHIADSSWLWLQRRALRRHLAADHLLHVAVEAEYAHAFTAAGCAGDGLEVVVIPSRASHYAKLDLLARRVLLRANDDDLLVFLDGDAFPVRQMGSVLKVAASGVPIAIQRRENLGDLAPHPSFFACNAGLWRELDTTWTPGPWTNAYGERVSDVGGIVYTQLTDLGRPWEPLLRTSTHKVHPMWFSVYGRTIYHHGAGFRFPVSRVDLFDAAQHDPNLHGQAMLCDNNGEKMLRVSCEIKRWLLECDPTAAEIESLQWT